MPAAAALRCQSGETVLAEVRRREGVDVDEEVFEVHPVEEDEVVPWGAHCGCCSRHVGRFAVVWWCRVRGHVWMLLLIVCVVPLLSKTVSGFTDSVDSSTCSHRAAAVCSPASVDVRKGTSLLRFHLDRSW